MRTYRGTLVTTAAGTSPLISVWEDAGLLRPLDHDSAAGAAWGPGEDDGATLELARALIADAFEGLEVPPVLVVDFADAAVRCWRRDQPWATSQRQIGIWFARYWLARRAAAGEPAAWLRTGWEQTQAADPVPIDPAGEAVADADLYDLHGAEDELIR